MIDFVFREEPTTSILQQHHGHILRWVEERRSRHEVCLKFVKKGPEKKRQTLKKNSLLDVFRYTVPEKGCLLKILKFCLIHHLLVIEFLIYSCMPLWYLATMQNWAGGDAQGCANQGVELW